MVDDQNPFGGGNKNSLYTPMSETEQEVVSRLIESNDIRVVVLNWGFVDRPRVTFGDLRVQVQFRLNFDRPEFPIPVHFFDLELRTGSGLLLFAQRQSAEYGGKPLQVAAGVYLDMIWDIAVRSMDPALIRQIKPGTTGLTSRWQDKDSKSMTLLGNTNMSSEQKRLLLKMRVSEAASRRDTANRVKPVRGGKF